MSKHSETFEGLILKNINFKDSDKIYTIFVRVLGKVSAKARGIRKFSSKRLSSLDSLNLVKIGMVGDHELKVITEVILIDSFKNIKADFNKLKTALYLIEIVSNYLIESSEYQDLFDLLIKCLKRLEETSYTDSRIENYFEYQFLKMTGYELNFYSCSFCDFTILDNTRFNFNFEKGGIVCENCSNSFNFFTQEQKNSLFLVNNLKKSENMDFKELDRILNPSLIQFYLKHLKLLNFSINSEISPFFVKIRNMEVKNLDFSKIVSLSKRRGFIFPGSEIYGGLANTYDFGPLGVEMLNNILDLWWKTFVRSRDDMHGLDTSILMNPKVWESSGHTQNFTDVLIDCRNCQLRTRADHLIEDHFSKKGEKISVEGKTTDELDRIIIGEKIPCPKCGNHSFTPVRKFNLLFETNVGIVTTSQNKVYLRGEIAQGMFVNFKNVMDTMRPKLPFGIAQKGKAFRNEITLGNFVFRTLEFNLAEFEYFFNPNKTNIDELFEYWKKEMEDFVVNLGVDRSKLRWRVHEEDERSHYSSRTEDLEYEFPFGFKEICGLAYRTDFDLRNHTEHSGTDLSYFDPETNEKFIPHVIEPTFGINRLFLTCLTDAYEEDLEENRTILKLDKSLSPYEIAIFPLVKNKPEIVSKASEVYQTLRKNYAVAFDSRGNIGKRYLSQDEIGTPFCVTVDYQTLEDETVTIRNRDTKEQTRIKISEIINYLK